MSIAFSLASSPELVGHRIFVTNVSVAGTMHEVRLIFALVYLRAKLIDTLHLRSYSTPGAATSG